MPIVEEGNNVGIEYEMPEYIKNLITDDFLKEFRKQLFRIYDHCGLETFAEEGIPMNTSTGGWYAAFGKACLLTNKEELLNYWRTLEWYDSDLFDDILSCILINRGFILGNLSDVIEQKLGIKWNELRECNDCGKLYTDDMVIEIPDGDGFESVSQYRCLHCNDVRDAKGNRSATDYYKNILIELDEYCSNNPVNEL